jgi:peptidoglycan hydrolase-like protein with peptidoglycan-binding domain
MSDPMVIAAQRFINNTYGNIPGIPEVEENGRTSWAVMYSLTRALQHELGISSLSNNFGPGTLSALAAQFPVIDEENHTVNILKIVQAGLYCKGYEGGAVGGVFDDPTASGIHSIKQNMGVLGLFPGNGVTPKVFKALLTMDPYVLVNNGRESVQTIQRWMNGKYLHRRDFFIVPCDGHFSRDVQKALMLAIQYELGMADGTANGNFGPGTQAGLRNNPVGGGSTGPFVQLFTAAMIFNRRSTSFSSTFTAAHETSVRDFQSFAKLAVNGRGDYQTWASLLVSTGDPTRAGTACDCIDTVTPSRADTLVANGYRYVGRYLSEHIPPGHPSYLNKAIQPGELETIRQKGLRVFPIYQTYGAELGYFTGYKGQLDALDAAHAAYHHGFKEGSRIYFAVDFDAMDHQVTSHIIPYFQGINERMALLGDPYRIGVYGPRNVCSRVGEAGASSASFVSGMSTGFSGNLGYPLPVDWAYDQISTISLGSGTGGIEIDNNIVSGRDVGQNSFNPPLNPDSIPDVPFSLENWPSLRDELQAYMDANGLPKNRDRKLISVADAAEHIVANDALYTQLANTYGMRKALMQVVTFWELCHISDLDVYSDIGVYLYHGKSAWDDLPRHLLDLIPIPEDFEDKVPIKDDSSTGASQIFARTAIDAQNHCIAEGYITGTPRDRNDLDDVWHVWERLQGEGVNHTYNMSQVPLIHIMHGQMMNGRRPSLTYSHDETYKVLARYQGEGSEVVEGAMHRTNIYLILDKYYTYARNL